VFICLRPPLHTVYIHYTYSHREGVEGWGRVEPKRRLEGQQFTKLGKKYQHMIEMYLQSINSDKHLLQSPCTGKFFLDDNLSLWFLYSKLVDGLRQSR
jgi:hypothetical protein